MLYDVFGIKSNSKREPLIINSKNLSQLPRLNSITRPTQVPWLLKTASIKALLSRSKKVCSLKLFKQTQKHQAV